VLLAPMIGAIPPLDSRGITSPRCWTLAPPPWYG